MMVGIFNKIIDHFLPNRGSINPEISDGSVMEQGFQYLIFYQILATFDDFSKCGTFK